MHSHDTALLFYDAVAQYIRYSIVCLYHFAQYSQVTIGAGCWIISTIICYIQIVNDESTN